MTFWDLFQMLILLFLLGLFLSDGRDYWFLHSPWLLVLLFSHLLLSSLYLPLRHLVHGYVLALQLQVQHRWLPGGASCCHQGCGEGHWDGTEWKVSHGKEVISNVSELEFYTGAQASDFSAGPINSSPDKSNSLVCFPLNSSTSLCKPLNRNKLCSNAGSVE